MESVFNNFFDAGSVVFFLIIEFGVFGVLIFGLKF